ncbi:MAG: GNAT family N-acetyltransferase [Candidatus Hodarchaeales archaeon]
MAIKKFTITTYNERNESLTPFFIKEWRNVDIEIFGSDISEDWKHEFDVACFSPETGNIIGAARCYETGGVIVISQLIVEQKYRKKRGIGSSLLNKIEELARQKKCHKIRVFASERHPVVFYEKSGYKRETTLSNDLFGWTWYHLIKDVT